MKSTIKIQVKKRQRSVIQVILILNTYTQCIACIEQIFEKYSTKLI